MSNRRDNRQHNENSADRIRRRMQRIEEERSRSARPKLNPFTLISIVVILVLALVMSNVMGQ